MTEKLYPLVKMARTEKIANPKVLMRFSPFCHDKLLDLTLALTSIGCRIFGSEISTHVEVCWSMNFTLSKTISYWVCTIHQFLIFSTLLIGVCTCIVLFSYLVNVCFYLLLKAHQIPVLNHPVIKRLVEYREVCLTSCWKFKCYIFMSL